MFNDFNIAAFMLTAPFITLICPLLISIFNSTLAAFIIIFTHNLDKHFFL